MEVNGTVPYLASDVPSCLDGLQVDRLGDVEFPCVYFLANNGEVVYVGQSTKKWD